MKLFDASRAEDSSCVCVCVFVFDDDIIGSKGKVGSTSTASVSFMWVVDSMALLKSLILLVSRAGQSWMHLMLHYQDHIIRLSQQILIAHDIVTSFPAPTTRRFKP